MKGMRVPFRDSDFPFPGVAEGVVAIGFTDSACGVVHSFPASKRVGFSVSLVQGFVVL